MTKIKSKIGEPACYAACYEQLAEECAELGHAALKVARILRNENPTPVSKEEALRRVDEEFADVFLTISVCGYNQQYVVRTINAKAERWEARLGGRD